MTRELYNVYTRMFENFGKLEDHVRSVLTKRGWKVYHVEIHVGKEETEEYICYIEYNNGSYRYLNGVLLTEEQIRKNFK